MNEWVALAIAVCVLFAAIAARMPVALALFGAGALGLFLTSSTTALIGAVSRLPYSSSARYVLVVIPLFMAIGVFSRHGKLATQAFALARRLLGRVPGGLAIAVVVACAIFAAVSGSSVATVAAMGPLVVDEMTKAGYSKRFAAGVVGAAGTLGVLIPPSIVLVLFGIVSGVSIGALLIAGILPGLLSAAVYGGAIYIGAVGWPHLLMETKPATEGQEEPVGEVAGGTSSEVIAADVDLDESASARTGFGVIARVGFLFGIVVGGLYFGILTVTESAAVGATVALIYLWWDAGRARARGIFSETRRAVQEVVALNSMIFFLLVGASVFSFFLVSAGIPREVASAVNDLDVSANVLLLIVLLTFIPLGMFLDPISMLLIGIPLTWPALQTAGVDGLWFGILVVKTIEIGLITPPFGMNGFVVSGVVPGLSVDDAFRGILRFLPLDVLTVALLFIFPSIVTWLPGRMAG